MKSYQSAEYHGFYDLCGQDACLIISDSGRRRNLAVARSHEVSPEERRHAQRALSHYDECTVEE